MIFETGGPIVRRTSPTMPRCSQPAVPTLTVEKLLHEVGEDHPSSPVEVHAVDMESPAIRLRDFIAAASQHIEAKGVAIDR